MAPEQAEGRTKDIGTTTDVYALGVCLLYTSDAADERSSVDLGGRRIIKKKKNTTHVDQRLRTRATNERAHIKT